MPKKYILISLLIVFIDQLTKSLSLLYIKTNEIINIFPGLNFILARNKGAAFSFLADHSGWQRWFFIILTFIVSGIIYNWIKNLSSDKKLEATALSFILGGAIGNLIDRSIYGSVVDFIDVYYKNYHWYTFNIADSFICVGAFIVASLILFKKV